MVHPSRFSWGFFALTILVVGLLTMVGCDDDMTVPKQEAPAEYKQITVEVSGMACAKGCAPRVQQALASLPWVKNVQVHFERKIARMTVETARLDEAAIAQVLEAEGFEGKVSKQP